MKDTTAQPQGVGTSALFGPLSAWIHPKKGTFTVATRCDGCGRSDEVELPVITDIRTMYQTVTYFHCCCGGKTDMTKITEGLRLIAGTAINLLGEMGFDDWPNVPALAASREENSNGGTNNQNGN